MEGEGEDSLLGGQWKEKEKFICLVVNGRRRRRFFAWWPMEGQGEVSLLGGQWKDKEKFLCLVANGRRRKRRRFFAWWPTEGEGEGSLLGGQWKEKEKVLFYLFHFPPKQLYLNPHFLSFEIKFLFYHGPRPLFTHSLPFPWPINYDHVS
jgi:hypothetical protein